MTQPQYQYINPAVLLDAAGQDMQVFVELTRTFLEIAPPMFERLAKAIEAGNLRVITLESHSLKGTVALIGAHLVASLLEQIESLSRHAELDRIRSMKAELNTLYIATDADVRDCLTYFTAQLERDATGRAR